VPAAEGTNVYVLVPGLVLAVLPVPRGESILACVSVSPAPTVKVAVMVLDCPILTVEPSEEVSVAVGAAGAPTEQDEYPYEPDNDPLEQLLVCAAHDCPYATDDDWYAVMELPWFTVAPHGAVQLAAEPTEQEEYAYEPDSVPLVHVRVCDVQEEPYATELDWYAVTELPWFTIAPLKVHLDGGKTVIVFEQVTVPPAPVKVPVYVVVCWSGEVVRVLLTGSPPHSGENTALVAFCEVQVMLTVPPCITLALFAVMVQVGAASVQVMVTEPLPPVPPMPP